MKKLLVLVFVLLLSLTLVSCNVVTPSSTEDDIQSTFDIGDQLSENQPTPTDIDYSLERLNLIARAYWVNGQRDKALNVLATSPVSLPLGYIVLFTDLGVPIASFNVQGKVSSLNSYLTPDYWYQDGFDLGEGWGDAQVEMPDVDGSYGSNAEGIFFFTVDGKYIEWTGTYLYSDMFISIDDPVLNIGGTE